MTEAGQVLRETRGEHRTHAGSEHGRIKVAIAADKKAISPITRMRSNGKELEAHKDRAAAANAPSIAPYATSDS